MTTDPRPANEAGEPAATEPAPNTSPTADVEPGTAHPNIADAPSVAARVATAEAAEPTRPRSRRNLILGLIGAIIALDIAAAILVPPFPAGQPGQPVTSIGDLILANLEFPAPHVVWSPTGEHHELGLLAWDVSLTSSLFTMWLVMGALLLVFIIAGRMFREVPGRLQNAVEFIWEALENWAVSLGGEGARRHIPLFAAFFLFILFSNWSGLLPFVGRIELLRAPTSDVNVTLGLALVVFVYFNFQGIRHLGLGGYLGKFFVFSGFKRGIAAGAIDLFVGLIEFMLEFIKPITLSMRLFGNIFGGEVALGVITALTIALIPAGMLLLESLLNFVQALIFSTLMLMYTVIAVESHHEEAEAAPEFGDDPQGIEGPPLASMRIGSH